MDDLYRDRILDHYRHARNKGSLTPADISCQEDNPLCGDQVRFDLRLDASGRITEVAWDGRGCAISMASASLLSERIKGGTLGELCHLGKDQVLELLGIELGPIRINCAMLALTALQSGACGQTDWPEEDEGF